MANNAPDIFLSYNREDADRARQFAAGFASQGLNVWWDVALRSGEAYDEVTEAALRNAKAVVVLWSKKSVVSRWVRAEATLAERKKTLMPAMIEPCERPIMFELVQTADLSAWNGSTSDRAWQAFAGHVCEFVGKAARAKSFASARAQPLPALDQVTVVVLPFANMSRDEEQEYFVDGITEDIITDLSKVSSLGVISRNSAFTYKGKNVDIPDVARQLNVTHVVEGSVRKVGNRVRVTAQLIDGSTNNHVWADRFDRNLDGIFELQDELSQAIVKALKVKLLPEEKKAISDRGTTSVEAYDLYLKASEVFSGAAGNIEQAFACARAAVAVDPDFSRAWGLLAIVCAQASYILPDARDDYVALCNEANDRAAACATDPVQALTIRAARLSDFTHDWLGAEQALDEAQKLAPEGKALRELTRAGVLLHTGQMNEAIEELQAWLRTDPFTLPAALFVALDAVGRHEEAMAEYMRIGRLMPSAIADCTALLGGMAYEDADAVRRNLESFVASGNELLPLADEILAAFDDPAAVLAVLRRAASNPVHRQPTKLTHVALAAAYFGDRDFAIECLRTALVEMPGIPISWIWHPLLAEARQTEGFRQLVRDLRIVEYWRGSGNWGNFARPVGDDDFEIVA
jgi:TolB-like protein